MPELSLKQRLVRHLRNDPEKWVHKGDLERESLLAGYLASNCARRLYELVKDGYIESRIDKNGSNEFRAIRSSLVPE